MVCIGMFCVLTFVVKSWCLSKLYILLFRFYSARNFFLLLLRAVLRLWRYVALKHACVKQPLN